MPARGVPIVSRRALAPGSWTTVDGRMEPWSADSYESLLARLEQTNNTTQADVLREAAVNGKGFVSRARVYEIGDYEPTRRLTGFTKPVVGCTRDLVASGDIPAGLEVALRARYNGPGRAIGFGVARPIAEIHAGLEADGSES